MTMAAAAPVAADAKRRRDAYLSGLALAAVGAVLFSGKAVIVKLAYRHGVDAVTLIALRMLFALPMFVLAAWWVERGPGARAAARAAQAAQPVQSARPDASGRMSVPSSSWQRGDVLRIVALGTIGYYLSSFLDFLGLRYISAGLERVILYLNPTLVLLIGLVWLRKRPTRREWLALAVAYAGVFVVFWHDLRLAGSNVPLGSLLVLASAATYAVYLVASGTLVKRLGPIRLTAWASIVSCVACIAQAALIEPAALWSQPAAVYWLSIVNAVFCTVLPVFIVMLAVDRIGSGPASQMGMIGPVSTIGLAAVLLGEPVTIQQLAGTAIVMVGVFILSTRRF